MLVTGHRNNYKDEIKISIHGHNFFFVPLVRCIYSKVAMPLVFDYVMESCNVGDMFSLPLLCTVIYRLV